VFLPLRRFLLTCGQTVIRRITPTTMTGLCLRAASVFEVAWWNACI
jgi:hypothetical protein